MSRAQSWHVKCHVRQYRYRPLAHPPTSRPPAISPPSSRPSVPRGKLTVHPLYFPSLHRKCTKRYPTPPPIHCPLIICLSCYRMSFADKATAFKHSVAGSTINKVVCKASSHELAGPKKKHVDSKSGIALSHLPCGGRVITILVVPRTWCWCYV